MIDEGDGIDNDCDGEIDENYESILTECGIGACKVNFNTECINGEESICIPNEPLSEIDNTCDGIDDNCNGEIDENATCNDNIVCTIDKCTPNGCEYDRTLCNEPCHKCDTQTQAIITTQNNEAGSLSFTYAGDDYLFEFYTNSNWIFNEINVVISSNNNDNDNFSEIYDFSDNTYSYNDLSTNEFYARIPAPTTCGEENIITVIFRVERISDSFSTLAYALGNFKPYEFNFPIITYYRTCCNPAPCVICHVNNDCLNVDGLDNDNPCLDYECIDNECISSNICVGPIDEPPTDPPIDEPPTNPPEQ